jgi:oligopeptide/dipeptide ABC transporter ATP-binding protein
MIERLSSAMSTDATQGFTHLHIHSHYTLLGGTASVDKLTAQAAAEGMTHLALTDTNALYGAVAFAKACREAGVQPILGMTATVAPLQGEPAEQASPPGRLVLLATSPDGYPSLCRLSSLIQGSPERESLAAQGLNWEALNAHREGLICLSGGRVGWIERCLRAVFKTPRHPYTAGLLRTIPRVGHRRERLDTIEGRVPNLIQPPPGCCFHPRCPQAMDVCLQARPPMIRMATGQRVACHLYT